MPLALPALTRWTLALGLALCAGILAAAVLPGWPAQWLGQPLSRADAHHVLPSVAWHGRLMVLSWGMLLPLGMLAARFCKVLPSQKWPDELDRKTWWHAHLWLQGSGMALMSAGLLLIVGHPGMPHPLARWHHACGWLLAGCATLQLCSGLLRGSKGGPASACLRGDHYDMSARRVVFECVHKGIGWSSLPLALATIAIGLVLADAPRWMPLLLCAWWLTLAVLALALQRAGWCIDTYQAIWGPDPRHPGNRRAPIGWGIARFASQSRSTSGAPPTPALQVETEE